MSGRISLIRGGKVLLEIEKPPNLLQAGMVGVITDLVAERGAIIETIGAVVQGVWGNGKMDFGLLQNKLDKPTGKLTQDKLDVSLRGTVVLGGYCDEPDVLRNAVNIPLKGLILSSMSASLVPLAIRMPLPIILLRGFGNRALDSDSYRLLTTNENREIVVNAVALDRFQGIRPEVVIPLSTQKEPLTPIDRQVFESGQKVRLTNTPSLNSIGIIEYITDKPTLLPSGLRSVSAHINLENDETVIMPLANLEIIT
jgi:hypothetical protein